MRHIMEDSHIVSVLLFASRNIGGAIAKISCLPYYPLLFSSKTNVDGGVLTRDPFVSQCRRFLFNGTELSLGAFGWYAGPVVAFQNSMYN